MGAEVSNTSALAMGGSAPPDTAATELWNGSSWTEVNDLTVATRNSGYWWDTNFSINIWIRHYLA